MYSPFCLGKMMTKRRLLANKSPSVGILLSPNVRQDLKHIKPIIFDTRKQKAQRLSRALIFNNWFHFDNVVWLIHDAYVKKLVSLIRPQPTPPLPLVVSPAMRLQFPGLRSSFSALAYRTLCFSLPWSHSTSQKSFLRPASTWALLPTAGHSILLLEWHCPGKTTCRWCL